MQARRIFYIILSSIFFTSCWHQKHLTTTFSASQNIVINSSTADTTNNFTVLNTYRDALNKTMNVVVGSIEENLKKDKPNSTLGNMVCDAMLVQAQKIDKNCTIAIANYGGLRIPYLNKGQVTLGNIYELMPFENTLSIIPLSGAWLDTICQKIAKAGGMPVSGLQFKMDKEKAVDIIVNKQPIDYSKTYTICVNSYMAAGGDNCDFLIPMPKQNTTVLIRDAIIDFIKMRNQNKLPIIQQPIIRITTK
jgi:2',3'-cyclic-nucleotide 2'-phosphodiesterase (5'-nucleotidase family)